MIAAVTQLRQVNMFIPKFLSLVIIVTLLGNRKSLSFSVVRGGFL